MPTEIRVRQFGENDGGDNGRMTNCDTSAGNRPQLSRKIVTYGVDPSLGTVN